MLRVFGHPTVATCDVLGVVGPNLIIFKLVACVTSVSVSKEQSVFCLCEIWAAQKMGREPKELGGLVGWERGRGKPHFLTGQNIGNRNGCYAGYQA